MPPPGTPIGSPLIAPLEALGFTLNEARAYAALVERGAQTGYEVGQHASIPRSAVYGVLRRLVESGAARSMPGGEGAPERFVATPIDSLVALLKQRFAASTDALEEAAKRIEPAAEAPDAFTVRGYDRVLEEAARLVQNAQKKLVFSAWPRELIRLLTHIREARARGVHIVVFSHAKLPEELCLAVLPTPAGTTPGPASKQTGPDALFSYGLVETDLEGFWKHRLVLVADDRGCLIGATEGRREDNAVVSGTAAIAELATSQIALDITLLAQRKGLDVQKTMASMLADRVGSLDALLCTS